ncbi:glycosyltransferase family 4 protein [Streptomyces uncialis]|uniref:glycosyltransferase family 4 protein n=1 Tax=Streptomyces uncialis TaxID=1048205 RepID=UPI00364B01CB
MKIAFLLHNAYAIGGTIRTTLNLAAALCDRHEVEIASMMRHREQPRFAVDPRVTLVPLVDTRVGRGDAERPEFHEPAEDFPAQDKRHHQYSRLVDLRAREYLKGCDADVIFGTRPGVNVYLSLFGPPTALRIAQEHLRHDAHGKELRGVLARHYRTLDALVTMTEADAVAYRSRMRLPGVPVVPVPNIVPAPRGVVPSDGSAKVIAAAGRLARGKRFDLLIEAFGKVAGEQPDWQLRIYGGGAQQERLQQLVDARELGGRAVLMGPRSPIEPEFAKASLVVSASDAESFGMTLVEAMRCGVPVISTDCPLGPAEIISDGVDGRLVPVGDAPALAAAMLDLIGDGSGRRAMGSAALESARRFDPGPIVTRYESLFAELGTSRGRRYRRRTRARYAASLRRRLRRPARQVRRWRKRLTTRLRAWRAA